MKWTFLGTWVPAAPLNIAMVQILQGHNPTFVGDLLGRKVKLVPVPILNEGTEKQTQKEVRTLGMSMESYRFFPFLTISFNSTNNPGLSHPMMDWNFFLRGRGGGFRSAAGL